MKGRGLLPSGAYAHTEQLLLLRVCMAYGMEPDRLDEYIERDPALVEQMVQAMLIREEEQSRRDEAMASIGAMRRV